MSDHLDAPGLKPVDMDARVDICDIYAFQKPEDADTSVLVFNVNPVAPTLADSFASEAVYELKVDTNGDAVAEIAYRFTFSPKEHGVQTATLRRASGEQAKGNGKDTFNRIEPTRDRELFTGKLTDLFASSGRSSEDAQQTALSLLPDILDYDYSSPAGYRNGRKLTDDII